MRAREQIAHSRWHSINFFRVLLLGSHLRVSVAGEHHHLAGPPQQPNQPPQPFACPHHKQQIAISGVRAAKLTKKKSHINWWTSTFFSLLFPACLPIKMQQQRARVLCRVARSHTGNVITVLDAKLDHKNGNSPRLFFFCSLLSLKAIYHVFIVCNGEEVSQSSETSNGEINGLIYTNLALALGGSSSEVGSLSMWCV